VDATGDLEYAVLTRLTIMSTPAWVRKPQKTYAASTHVRGTTDANLPPISFSRPPNSLGLYVLTGLFYAALIVPTGGSSPPITNHSPAVHSYCPWVVPGQGC
jgi:hypothetical protein